MLMMHKALLAWLITGTPPELLEIGCLNEDIVPPPSAHIGPYTQQSVAATIDCPHGEYWRPTYPAQTPVEAPNMAALTRQQSQVKISQGNVAPPPTTTSGPTTSPTTGSTPTTRVDIPRSMICGKKTAKPGEQSPTYILSYEEIKCRNTMASSRENIRAQGNRTRKILNLNVKLLN